MLKTNDDSACTIHEESPRVSWDTDENKYKIAYSGVDVSLESVYVERFFDSLGDLLKELGSTPGWLFAEEL